MVRRTEGGGGGGRQPRCNLRNSSVLVSLQYNPSHCVPQGRGGVALLKDIGRTNNEKLNCNYGATTLQNCKWMPKLSRKRPPAIMVDINCERRTQLLDRISIEGKGKISHVQQKRERARGSTVQQAQYRENSNGSTTGYEMRDQEDFKRKT